MILAALALLQAAQPDPFADIPRTAPPCRNGAAECDPWDRYSTPVAPGWEYVATTATGSLWLMHRATVSSSYYHHTTVRVWIRMDHSRDRTVRQRGTRGLLVIRCRPRLFDWEDITRSGPNGLPIGDIVPRASGGNIAPDSVIETVWQLVCPASETGRPS